MTILALDLGTNLGWAIGRDRVRLACGTEILASAKSIKEFRLARMDRRRDPRIVPMWNFMLSSLALFRPDWVVFEDVQFSSTTQQTQLWSSFRGLVWIFSHLHNLNIECCPVGTLKKFATNHGGATKDMMAKAWVKSHPEFELSKGKVIFPKSREILDDNCVDALHLLEWAFTALRNFEKIT